MFRSLRKSDIATIIALIILIRPAAVCTAQQPGNSGVFVLHKFARAIGRETYSIETKGDTYTLSSHFLFTDRGSAVPLETTFVAKVKDMQPESFSAKGKSSRISKMDDVLTFRGSDISMTLSGKSVSETVTGPWFVTDGYLPVAMQEQMMRWWLLHGRPAEFTALPSMTKVHIQAAEPLTIQGHSAEGYTISGLIWGQECLWIDSDRNLIALVSTDAEFDHFEAVREPYADSLAIFIAAAAKSNLAALERLSATARMAPAKLLAITGATLENSDGSPPITDSVILIEGGVIRAIGSRKQVTVPANATILDASGKYAIPGLWDMHAHYEQVEWGPIYLAAGVTSVRDVGNEFDFIRTLHDQLDRPQNPAIGPHLEFAGIIDGTGPRSLGAIIADTPEQAQECVEKYKAAGARQIKIYSSVKPEIVKAITADAHAHGVTVTGHIPIGMNAIEGVNDGMDQINHLTYETPYFSHPVLGADGKPDKDKLPILEIDGPRAKELIETLKAHHTVLDPTLAVYETFRHVQPLDQLEPGLDHVAPQLREALDSPPATPEEVPMANFYHQLFMSTLRALHQAGIPVVAGTDQAIPGYSLHREMELYVEAGFTPLEALQSATIEAAKALGVDNESGSLAVGKRGDILLLNADPLADIHNSRTVWRTVAAGAVYDPAPLWRSVGFTP